MSDLNLNDGKFRPSIGGIENGKTSQVVGVNSILNAIVGNTNYLKAEVDKKANRNINITAGNGLQGGGNLTTNRTINVVSTDDSLVVGADSIKVNTYNGVDGTSTTRPGSANAVKMAYDKANTKLDAGLVSTDYNSGKKIEDKIKSIDSGKVPKTTQVIAGNGLAGGGVLNGNVTLNVVSADEGIIVNADNIKLNIINDYNTANSLRPVSGKVANDLYKLIQGFNKCPYNVGDIFLTTNSTNPSTVWLGTTWQKIEGRFLLGTSGSGASKATGGSMTKTIAKANLPNVKLTVDSFNLSRGTMDITGDFYTSNYIKYAGSGAFYTKQTGLGGHGGDSGSGYKIGFQASRSWTGTTSSASPQTSALGSGTALDITPSYYTAHMWLRTA